MAPDGWMAGWPARGDVEGDLAVGRMAGLDWGGREGVVGLGVHGGPASAGVEDLELAAG